jgi:hypothetical protein
LAFDNTTTKARVATRLEAIDSFRSMRGAFLYPLRRTFLFLPPALSLFLGCAQSGGRFPMISGSLYRRFTRYEA